jgi:diaminopimelate decarboxylase
MNIDVVRHHAQLPLLQRGDRVAVHHTGAYNMTQWMQFIHMRPRVVLIDGASEVHIVREAEDLAYLEQLERVPDHLPPGLRRTP